MTREFEIEKERAIEMALDRELARLQREAEEAYRDQTKEEIRLMTERHKQAISETKKKQWVKNERKC